MGLGFNLFGFPILLLSSVGLIIYFFVTKRVIALKILGMLWGSAILIFAISSVIGNRRMPIRLTKEDIVGEYRIDTTFFPGANARWQYDHYKFFITGNDSIHFIVMKEKEIPIQVYRHRITYTAGPPALWSIVADTSDHLINQPILYRGHNKFYYVFRSKKFGNMFFRKV
jgi:hypothetical protein